MKKHLLLFVACASFVLLAACATVSSPPKSKTSLWEVISPQRVVYIASDTQVLSTSDYPLPAQFAAAFSKSSGGLYVEQIPATSKKSQGEIHSLVLKFGVLPGKRTLEDLLTPAQLATVKAATKAEGLPFSHFERLRPWLPALALMSDPAQRAKFGIKAQQQLTSHFYRAAKAHGVPVTPFESYTKIFHIASSMPTEVQINWLVYVSKHQLDEQDKGTKIRKLVNAWRVGDTAAVAALSGSFKAVPKVRQALVVQRNQRWVHVLEGKLRTTGEPIFVVVGDGHLMGQDNMLALLREGGYQVRQL